MAKKPTVAKRKRSAKPAARQAAKKTAPKRSAKKAAPAKTAAAKGASKTARKLPAGPKPKARGGVMAPAAQREQARQEGEDVPMGLAPDPLLHTHVDREVIPVTGSPQLERQSVTHARRVPYGTTS